MVLELNITGKAGLIKNEKIIALEFTQSYTTKTLSLTDTSLWKGFVEMVRQGIWHNLDWPGSYPVYISPYSAFGS